MKIGTNVLQHIKIYCNITLPPWLNITKDVINMYNNKSDVNSLTLRDRGGGAY